MRKLNFCAQFIALNSLFIVYINITQQVQPMYEIQNTLPYSKVLQYISTMKVSPWLCLFNFRQLG